MKTSIRKKPSYTILCDKCKYPLIEVCEIPVADTFDVHVIKNNKVMLDKDAYPLECENCGTPHMAMTLRHMVPIIKERKGKG